MEDDALLADIEEKSKKELKVKRHILKTLSLYMKGGWAQVYAAWAFVFLEVICEVLIPFLSQFLVDSLHGGQDSGLVWGYAIGMVALALVSCTCGIVAGLFAATAAARFGRNVRKGMYYKIQEFSFKNIDKFSTPSLVTRLTTDVTNVQNSWQAILRIMVRAPFMLILASFRWCSSPSSPSWRLSYLASRLKSTPHSLKFSMPMTTLMPPCRRTSKESAL